MVESGKSTLLLPIELCHRLKMPYLTGNFECKLDPKSRMMIPAGLKKKLPEIETEGIVINCGFKNNLVIYTKSQWDKRLDELGKLNEFDEDSADFIRYFTSGATELTLDAAGRVLIPKFLLEHAGIKSDVMLTCQLNKVEVWDAEVYKSTYLKMPKDFAALAQKVLGSKAGRADE